MNSKAGNHGHHISQQFNAELEAIKKRMLEMGGAVEQQLSDAMVSITSADSGLGARVMKEDDAIDELEVSIDEECSLILARRQPAASDLRLLSS